MLHQRFATASRIHLDLFWGGHAIVHRFILATIAAALPQASQFLWQKGRKALKRRANEQSMVRSSYGIRIGSEPRVAKESSTRGTDNNRKQGKLIDEISAATKTVQFVLQRATFAAAVAILLAFAEAIISFCLIRVALVGTAPKALQVMAAFLPASYQLV